MKKVVIIGTGGHAKTVADIVLQSGDDIVGFLTLEKGIKTFWGRPILGENEAYVQYPECYFVIAIGNAEIRERLYKQMGDIKWYTAIHPAAVVSPHETEIGEGSVVMAGAVIGPGAKVGKQCIINTRAVVEHDNTICDFAHISVGAVLSGTVKIGVKSWIGAGAIVSNNIEICGDCMVGAGAVVIKDIYQSGTYVGVPAKKIK